jgi:cell division protein FtsB
MWSLLLGATVFSFSKVMFILTAVLNKSFMIKLKRLSKNFYFISGILFLVWMLFFDSNDLFLQFQRSNKLHQLGAKKEFYLVKIDEVEKDRKELLSDDELLEKYARENYLMRKPTEDLYIVVEQPAEE